jgi:hypothetical protein
MTQKNLRNPSGRGGGFFNDLSLRARLVVRLMRDRRVHPLLKLLPVGALIYLVFPDLLPFNPIDDALVLWLGAYLFIELCPQDVVQEHMRALQGEMTVEWREVPPKDDSIDGEFRDPS